VGSDDLPPPLVDSDDLEELLAPNAGAAVIGYWLNAQAAYVAPAMAWIAAEFADEPVHVRGVDVERAPALLEALGVRSLPTVLLCLNGEVLDALVGRIDPETLARRVRWLLQRSPTPQGIFARLFGPKRSSA